MGGGGKGSSKQPSAPDYAALAAQQGQINQDAAAQLTAANRPNQYDAFGNSITWSQELSGEQKSQQAQLQQQLAYVQGELKKYPNSAFNKKALADTQAQLDKIGSGTWTQQQSLNPETKAAWDTYNKNAAQASSSYGDILNKYLSNYQSTPFGGGPQVGAFNSTAGNVKSYDDAEFNGDNVADALYNSVMDRARPEQERNSAAMDTQLKQQGLIPGTESYNNAMQNLLTSQNDANSLASQNAVLAGGAEGRAKYSSYLAGQGQQFGQDLSGYGANLQGNAQNYNQGLNTYQTNQNTPLQQLSGLAGIAGGTPYTPTYTGFSSATGYNPTDLLGAAQAQQAAAQSSTNSSNSKKGSTLGAASGLGGAYLGSK